MRGVAFFRNGARPPHDEKTGYGNTNRALFDAWQIFQVLAKTSSFLTTSRGCALVEARLFSIQARCDPVLGGEVEGLHEEKYGTYEARDIRHLVQPQGWLVGGSNPGPQGDSTTMWRYWVRLLSSQVCRELTYAYMRWEERQIYSVESVLLGTG